MITVTIDHNSNLLIINRGGVKEIAIKIKNTNELECVLIELMNTLKWENSWQLRKIDEDTNEVIDEW